MDKIINYKRHSLNNVQQILKMQDLLDQYDRQNLFLNQQVDTLIKQNIKLKQQQLHHSLHVSRAQPSNYSSNSKYQNHPSRVKYQYQGSNSKYENHGSNLKYQDHAYKTKYQDNESKIRYENQGSKIRIQGNGQKIRHNNTPYLESSKPNSFLQPRKSKYEYLFDEQQLRDLKNNIKNELRSNTKKHISTKETQTNTQQTQQLSYSRIPSYKTTQNTPIKKPLQTKKLHQSKSSLIKPLWQSRNDSINEFDTKNFNISNSKSKQKSQSKSKSKQKQTTQKKLEVISKSRIYLQKNITTPSKNIIQTTQQSKPQPKSMTITKEFYLEKSDVLQHSFGQNQQKSLQKRMTLLQSDLPSGLKEQNLVNESRMTIKLMPLSIQNKEIQTNLQKNEERSAIYHQPIINRTSSQSKRRHSLNPSPKVDIQPTQLFTQKVQPFMLKTEEPVPIKSVELSRSPVQTQQKRKFIKIVSSKKISTESSPKRK